MAKIGNIPEINAVKVKLEGLKERGLIKDWELPYENILTRVTAAIFFLDAADRSDPEDIWRELNAEGALQYRRNEEKLLSKLDWRVEFNKGIS